MEDKFEIYSDRPSSKTVQFSNSNFNAELHRRPEF